MRNKYKTHTNLIHGIFRDHFKGAKSLSHMHEHDCNRPKGDNGESTYK